jgi:CubicO group peptidase (beta-lactamase class C family)
VVLAPLVDRLFEESDLSETYAAVVMQGGEVVAERYGGELEHWDRPNEPVTASTRLLSWSMAKSMLHATVGLLVGDGRLALDQEWRDGITLDHLLQMRDGLDFEEDYVDAGRSDVIEMLFGAGSEDVAGFAADRKSVAPPGTRFNYSSGTSNIVSGIVRGVLGDGYEAFLRERLFDAIGMRSARPTFDAAGTWVASSYVHATARDFARFGLLYLRDGVVDGRRVLPEGWVEHGRTPRSVDPEDGREYGAHWWIGGEGHGAFSALGYEGQSILVCPDLDLVAVRLGKTPKDRDPHLQRWRAEIVDAAARARGR